MVLTPTEVLADLEEYLGKLGFYLDPDARTLITEIERLGYELDRTVFYEVIIHAVIEHFGPLRSLMLRYGLDPEDAIIALQQKLRTSKDDGYKSEDNVPYSDQGWRGSMRARFIDYAMAAARKNGARIVRAHDIVAGLLEEFDDSHPPVENSLWADEKLHVLHNTLSHPIGCFIPSLWIRFDVLREELGLLSLGAARQAQIEAAPSHAKPATMSLLADHPNYRTNCFLIMPFRPTEFHQKVETTLRRTMAQWGITLLRADDKHYSDDVLSNIEAYMYGCRFGIALHERVLSNDHNANVAFEIGYMLGLRKHVCLLKEKTVERLPSDLQGRLYVEFDGFAIESTLERALMKWLIDKGLLPGKTVA